MSGATSARDRALKGFEETWGARPTGLVRAPGRVNLIGEHIDYCGLDVLPMALCRAVWLAFRPSERPLVRVATSVAGLEPAEFAAPPPIEPGPAGDWSNYVRAAVQTVAVADGGAPDRTVCGLDAFAGSDLPVAAGLSSSSALVVAAALAWLAALGRPRPDPLRLASRLAAGERYVGTAGGGMDQAASLLGRPGHAVRVGFDPLSARPIEVPETWRLVVGHSGTAAEKAGAARDVYNLRTREAGAAAAALGAALGPAETSWDDASAASFPTLLARRPPRELIDLAARTLPSGLARRARHIVSEAARVDAAEACMRAGDLDGMGRLLDASHASLRDDYEVSTPALDALVDTAREAGAAGARLTGAGLGGCAIALCDADTVDRVLEAVAGFEAGHGGPGVAFVAEAGAGAEIERLE